jgi:carboxypeptidase C (cathepsin A)
MLEALEWSGQEGFVAEELREWSTDKQASAGQTKSFGNLTYIDIRGAGHMVSSSAPRSLVRR